MKTLIELFNVGDTVTAKYREKKLASLHREINDLSEELVMTMKKVAEVSNVEAPLISALKTFQWVAVPADAIPKEFGDITEYSLCSLKSSVTFSFSEIDFARAGTLLLGNFRLSVVPPGNETVNFSACDLSGCVDKPEYRELNEDGRTFICVPLLLLKVVEVRL